MDGRGIPRDDAGRTRDETIGCKVPWGIAVVTKLLLKTFAKSLYAKLLLMSLLIVSVPTAMTSYTLYRQAREARIEEKIDKLYGLARILDDHLGPGGFDGLLSGYRGDPGDKAAKIAFLNRKLAGFTDAVARANPGIGVGYYSRALDAMITYGPSVEYGNTVGLPIPPSHPGREVMAFNRPEVKTGILVRGSIMNAMWPIRRDGKAVGYIWSNELTDDIERQIRARDHIMLSVTIVGIAFGIALAHLMSSKLSRDVMLIKNGLSRMQYDLAQPIRQPSGEIGEIVVSINAMAKSLLEERSLNENILNSIADGVVAIDEERRVTAINPAAARMIGCRAEDVIGKSYHTLFATDAQFTSMLLDTLETGREHVGMTYDFPAHDQTFLVNASSSLLNDASGTTIGAVVVLKDLSEQQRLHKQIMRADRLAGLGELMAGVAHEIRNPLTSIRGFMQHLSASDSIEEWRRYAPLIVSQVDSLNSIITELLRFGRQRPPSIGPVLLNNLIRKIIVLAGKEPKANIVLDLHEDLPVIEADGEALGQVLLNLIINASQAMDDSGEITISTANANADEVVVTVTDTGAGIAPENLEKVFDPFFSTKPTGTGLGLAMVHRIVDAHYGTVTIESAVGEGTRVSLHLPILHRPPGRHS